MTEYKQVIFSGTLVHPTCFRLRLFSAFSGAWFAKNNFLTELNSPNSAKQFSFATFFQDFNFVRCRSNSRLKFSYGCSLQGSKPFGDIFSHLWEINKQTLGNNKKTALILSSESVTMLTREVVADVRVVRNHSKSTSFVFFVFITICFHSAFPFIRF